MAEEALWIVVGLAALALAGCLVWLLLKSRHSGRQGRLLNPMPRSPLIIAAWLILGPLVGAVISLATGGPLSRDIMLATTGGLLGGGVSCLIGSSDVDAVLTMISVLVGAMTLMLFFHALMGMG